MDSSELKRLIVQEILRALQGEESQGHPSLPISSSLPSPPRAISPSPSAAKTIVLFTGSTPPSPWIFESLSALALEGKEIAALLSLSFRLTQYNRDSTVIGNLRPIANPDDEAWMLELARRCESVLIPDVSLNTLNKVVLGIEDSAPSRLLADATRFGKPCLFVESVSSPTIKGGGSRVDLIRRLSGRGAILSCPDTLLKQFHEAIRPPEEKIFKPPVPPPPTRRRILTKEDVYEASRRGVVDWVVDAGTIVTAEAREDARRRGMTIRSEDET